MYNPLVYYTFGILTLFLSIIPFLIYLKYGRDPKIDYDASYEKELPFDDPPAVVNALCNNSSNVGEPDINGYIATIMDLIDRKYIIMADSSHQLSINFDKDLNDLWYFEKDVVREQHSLYGETFQNFYQNWKENIKYSLWNDGNLKEFFSRKGDKYLKIFGITGIVSSILLLIFIFDYIAISYIFYIFFLYLFSALFKFIISLKPSYKDLGSFINSIVLIGPLILVIIVMGPFTFQYLLPLFYNQNFDFSVNFFSCSLIILGFSLIFSLIIPKKICSQRTSYGKEYYERWMSFKRYINDYSLINKYPPESVQLWNKYLVYATALGSAEGVRKAMKKSLPHKELEGNYIYGLQEYDTFDSVMKNAILTAFGLD